MSGYSSTTIELGAFDPANPAEVRSMRRIEREFEAYAAAWTNWGKRRALARVFEAQRQHQEVRRTMIPARGPCPRW